jgi:hypothetical protein
MVPMYDLAMAHDGSVVVPGLGNAVMTPWAAKQIAHTFGYREKWLDTVATLERPVEITKRFRSSSKTVRLRVARGRSDVVRGLHYATTRGALVGDIFQALICTTLLHGGNPLRYLTALFVHYKQAEASPQDWLP